MALCTQCGNIVPDEEIETHVCDAATIPGPGKEKKPTTTEIDK
jgi:hypothetical protein